MTGGVSFGRFVSRFFSSVRRNTLIVVRNDLCGLQSSAERGECSQTGQEAGSVDWQSSHIACSQQGRRKGLTANLLQIAHRSFAGMSSGASDLFRSTRLSVGVNCAQVLERTRLMSSAWASVMAVDAAIV